MTDTFVFNRCIKTVYNNSLSPHTSIMQGRTNPRHNVTMATKLYMAAHNICRLSVWNLLHVTFVAHRILRWLLGFWENCILRSTCGAFRLTVLVMSNYSEFSIVECSINKLLHYFIVKPATLLWHKFVTVLFGHLFGIIPGQPHTCNPSIQSFIYIIMFILPLKLFGSLGQTMLSLWFYDLTDNIRGWFYGLAFALPLCYPA